MAIIDPNTDDNQEEWNPEIGEWFPTTPGPSIECLLAA